jgi:hypothetical protein
MARFLEPVKRLEIGINPTFPGLLVQVELKTLLENVHKGPPEHAQIHSAAQFAGQQYAAERTDCISGLCR